MLKRVLQQPLTRSLEIDSPEVTILRRTIIRKKPALRDIYGEWYKRLVEALPAIPGPVLEVGAGAGFLREMVSGLITSEIFPVPEIDVVLDACRIPLRANCLRGIVMTNVFHHIPDARQFLAEAARCVRPGGVVAMVEPWSTRWSRLVYGRLHHEPFDPGAEKWEFTSSGPLSGANGALPWIVFRRDQRRFEQEFPQWRVASIVPMMPFRYLLSGGLAYRSLVPGFALPLCRAVEAGLNTWREHLGMFALIVLRRGPE